MLQMGDSSDAWQAASLLPPAAVPGAIRATRYSGGGMDTGDISRARMNIVTPWLTLGDERDRLLQANAPAATQQYSFWTGRERMTPSSTCPPHTCGRRRQLVFPGHGLFIPFL